MSTVNLARVAVTPEDLEILLSCGGFVASRRLPSDARVIAVEVDHSRPACVLLTVASAEYPPLVPLDIIPIAGGPVIRRT